MIAWRRFLRNGGLGCAALVALASVAAADPTPTNAPPRSAWTMGPWSDPAFFPLAVWLQFPENARAYRRAGFNTGVGLWRGPTEEQLAAFKDAGLHLVCAQNEVGLRHRNDPLIIAWMHDDEPDNAQGRGARLG
jgi:hypothetical protein